MFGKHHILYWGWLNCDFLKQNKELSVRIAPLSLHALESTESYALYMARSLQEGSSVY